MDFNFNKSVQQEYLNAVSVTLQGPLTVAGLKVPQLDGGILGCGDHVGKYRVEDDPVMMDQYDGAVTVSARLNSPRDRSSVPGEFIFLRRSGYPLPRRPFLSCRGPRAELLLCFIQLALQLIYLKHK